jgi:hypothetical protein
MRTAIIPFALCAACSVPEHHYIGLDYETVVELPATPNRNLDLLFVIDNSASMADKQNNLVANFPNFIERLNQLDGGLPDLHLGIVSTDMGTKGTDAGAPGPAIGQIGSGGCSGVGGGGSLTTNGSVAVTGNFISDIKDTDGTRLTNYTGTLDTVFSEMATLGSTGCGFEQPLHAMQAALDNNVDNDGFLRPDALLAVLFLTDEDDCTISSPQLLTADTTTLGALQSFRCTRFGVTCDQGGATADDMNVVGAKDQCHSTSPGDLLDDVPKFHDFLVGLKDNPNKVIVGGIIGNPTPVSVELRTPPGGGTAVPALAHSCTYLDTSSIEEVADPGVRMQDFFDLFPDRAATTTICQPDLSTGLDSMGKLVQRAIGTPCVTSALGDSDPNAPGLQPDCFVQDVLGTTVTPIDACDDNGNVPPCWRLVPDATNCPDADHLKLLVDRVGEPDPATVTQMLCRAN